jgi:hypothetical protein
MEKEINKINFKERDRSECENYRCISFMSVVLTRATNKGLQKISEYLLMEEQSGV